jgi:adenosine/AMP kinase
MPLKGNMKPDSMNEGSDVYSSSATSRSVIGIVDGLSSRAIESEDDKQNRSKLLRDLGYKK